MPYGTFKPVLPSGFRFLSLLSRLARTVFKQLNRTRLHSHDFRHTDVLIYANAILFEPSELLTSTCFSMDKLKIDNSPQPFLVKSDLESVVNFIGIL